MSQTKNFSMDCMLDFKLEIECQCGYWNNRIKKNTHTIKNRTEQQINKSKK